MSQTIFSTIDTDTSGTELAAILNDFKDALVSGLSGTARPTELDPGGMWVDTALDPASWSLKLYTGTTDIEIVKIDLSGGVATSSLAVDSFSVRKVSADSVGAIMNLVKRRIASNGQVASSDVVGEIRIVGRTNTSTDPVVAKIIWTAGENQTATAFGGTLSIYSTPAGSATLVEHLKFAASQIESVLAHKLNAIILATFDVGTTATINQLDASKPVIEMTGTTATEIRGLNSGQASKVVTVHARTSAPGSIVFKHESASAAAADRFTLPNARDLTIPPQACATFIYSVADSRWKLQYKSADFPGFTTAVVRTGESWVAPTGTTQVRVVANRSNLAPDTFGGSVYGRIFRNITGDSFGWGLDNLGSTGSGAPVNVVKSSPTLVLGGKFFSKIYSTSFCAYGLTGNGAAYAWGMNAFGQLGVGDVTPRSSPVAVLGGLTFSQIIPLGNSSGGAMSALGLTSAGTLYSWGLNTQGALGTGNNVHQSAPIAVVGGLSFRKVVCNGNQTVLGLTLDGSLYAWGYNGSGVLGVGDTTSRSSPVAVLGGLKFSDVSLPNFGSSVLALAQNGTLYSWGMNSDGQLGLGDVVPRSSPVQVLGGLVAKKIWSRGSVLMALTTSGALYSWGSNSLGKLGVGNVVPRSSPVAVLGGLVFKDAAPDIVDGESTIGLTTTGALYSWGYNHNGQLGVGDVVLRSSPVAVLGGLTWASVAAMGQSANYMGISSSGAPYSWGGNSFGYLGTGDTTPRSSPVAVLGGLNLGLPVATTAQYDMTVVPGNTYTFTAGVEKCFFGSLALMDNTEYLDLEYVIPT